MAKSKFDEFMNLYDQETRGKYTYHYRNLWDACQYADKAYENTYKKSVWEIKTNQKEWVYNFIKGMKEKDMAEELQKNVEGHLLTWLEAIS